MDPCLPRDHGHSHLPDRLVTCWWWADCATQVLCYHTRTACIAMLTSVGLPTVMRRSGARSWKASNGDRWAALASSNDSFCTSASSTRSIQATCELPIESSA